MINKDFFAALEELQNERKINKDFFIQSLETALATGYKKHTGEERGVLVKLNPEKCTIKFYAYQTVVDEVEFPEREISVEDAKLIKKSYKAGDLISQEVSTKDFGRVAAQISKQVVFQKIREAEREIAVGELSKKQNEIVSCLVKRVDDGLVYVDIPGTSSEGIMQQNDQIPGEHYRMGDRIKVYVKNIKESSRGTFVQVSRANTGFVKRLLELEIPEFERGEIELKGIVREAGYRTKIAVSTSSSNIDPVGCCVGNKGIRINAIVDEMYGEKIDVIEYSENPLEYIAKALSPATVNSVYELGDPNTARAVVPDDKLSLAIGKGGRNVRLAVKLTGWKIDVKSESAIKTIKPEIANENQIFDIEGEDIFKDID